MIRVVLFLLVVGALALGAAWLADRPGDVVVTWQGMRIETSLMVLIAAILVAMAVLGFVWTVLRTIFTSHLIFRRHLHRRRGERAYEAISRGLIAVGSEILRPRASTPPKLNASRRLNRWRCSSARNRRSSRAIVKRRTRPSAPWQAVLIPRRSACTDFS